MSTSGSSAVEGSGLVGKKGSAWASAKASERGVLLLEYGVCGSCLTMGSRCTSVLFCRPQV
jgi:hypothetical protein